MSPSHHIVIEEFECMVLIGVYPHERLAPQRLLISLDIEVNFSKAIVSDNVSDTIDYDLIAAELREICQSTSFHLLERLAAEIQTCIMTKLNAIAVTVTIEKPNIIQEAKAIKIKLS